MKEFVRGALPALAAIWVLTDASSAAFAAVASIHPIRDNTLFEDNPTYSCGNGPLFSGETQFALSRRAVLLFDVAGSIPAGSTIQSAVLRMNVIQSGPSALPSDSYKLNRLLQSWGESTSVCSAGNGAPAAPGDATWSHRFYGSSSWTVPGGDYDALASGSDAMPTLGAATWTSQPGMVSDAQSWLDTPAGNFGWIIIGMESVLSTARAFGSREGSSPPSLEVNYSPPPAGPPEVPDGRLAPPLRLAKLTPDGASLRVEWDASLCTGNPGHHVVFGTRSNFPVVPGGTYGFGGSVCAIGATSPFVWNGVPDPAVLDPSLRMLWLLVLADDTATTEGSWGRNGALQERNGPGANGCSSQCGILDKSVVNQCGQGF